MAIQLNDRDYLIFKLLAEHNVLLEKHIAWFIAQEDKPVLIRDRLRKLFYLDYLLCQRYDNKLSWWTTPTKPLVYMLTPLARAMAGSTNGQNEVFNHDQQQKYLEIANLRMIFLIAQTEGLLQNFQWTTCKSGLNEVQPFDALISFTNDPAKHTVGIFSHPELNDNFVSRIEQGLNDKNATKIMIISKDQPHQTSMQKVLGNQNLTHVDKIIFAVHQDLYKNGINKVSWSNVANEHVNFLNQSNTAPAFLAGQNQVFTDIHAA